MDELDRRLQHAGAQSGDVRVALMWHTVDDLDLYVIAPSGERIDYRNKTSRCGGKLDVDRNADGGSVTTTPVENIYWPAGRQPTGTYKAGVQFFRKRSVGGVPFMLLVERGGSRELLHGSVCWQGQEVQVTTIHVSVAPTTLFQETDVFGFKLSVEAVRVAQQFKLATFVRSICSSLGGCRLGGMTQQQQDELMRLRKIMERADDVANFGAERANAHRLLQMALTRLDWPESRFRDACSGFHPGEDARTPTLATLEFAKKVTTRREWFEQLAREVAHPLGVAVAANRATGCFGKVGHNGVALCGTPAATVIAATYISRVAQAAMRACNKTDADSFCGNYCQQVYPRDSSNPDARRASVAQSQQWLRSHFCAQEGAAEWNTPKKFRDNTPTAELGRSEGKKRKADMDPWCDVVRKHQVKALGY